MSVLTAAEQRAKDFFINGGGGFEDGEDGAQAVTFSFLGMLEMAVAFAEHDNADLQRQLAAKDAEIAKLKRNLVASVRAALEAAK